MEPITAYRETDFDVPWKSCVRTLTEILTADESSGERARLVGRTNLRITVAAEVAEKAHRFHMAMREAVASLADALSRTIATAVCA